MADRVPCMLQALLESARVGSVMLDGDEAGRIITARAMHHIAHPDSDYRFLSADHYDVDHATFLRMKKTLLRLERLLDFVCSTSLWVVVDGPQERITLAVQNGTVHPYYRFGQGSIDLPPEMAECIETGRTVVAPVEHPSATLTVLAPVFDSLGALVGVVELSALPPASRSLPPAWS